MKSNFELVTEFHKEFSIPQASFDDIDTCELRLNLIDEERYEMEKELFPYNYNNETENYDLLPVIKSKLAKELADLLYVVYGTAVTFDIPIDHVFKLVHKSNMSKLGNDGKPVYREDGKVTKGPNYKPPDLIWLDKKEEDE